MWDLPQDFDRDIPDMSQEIQREITENVKKQKSNLVKVMKEPALKAHNTSKVVYQAQSGQKRRSLMTAAEAERLKRQKGDKTPGLGSHVDSSQGYPSDRTSPAPYPGSSWEEPYPTHTNFSQGKGGKGKSGKGKGKGSSKGRGRGKPYARNTWGW